MGRASGCQVRVAVGVRILGGVRQGARQRQQRVAPDAVATKHYNGVAHGWLVMEAG